MREAHYYDASNFEYLDAMWAELAATGELLALPTTVQQDSDVIPDMPLYIGMDYNANINWIVAGQVYGDPESFLTFGERRNRGDFNERSSVRVASEFGRKRLNVVHSFYTKFERKIPALIADFCAYYETHQNKTVVFYYDTNALGSNYAVNEQDFRWVVIHKFERHGWRVQDAYIGNPMKHHEKYLEINEAFAGRRKLMPFINRQNNEDLILAMQTAGVSRGRNSFRKDKGGEKLAETEKDLLQHRTDGTNAFDTLYIGCAKFPQNNFSPIVVSGVS